MERKSFFKYIVLLISLFGCVNLAKAQNIQVQAKLDRINIRIGEQTMLHISIRHPAKQLVALPQLTDTITGKIQIVGSKTDTAVDKTDKNTEIITQNLIITSFDAGAYIIPSFTFKANGNEYKTNTLGLQVQTVTVDTTKAIYDIKQPFSVSYSFIDWLRDNWVWVVIGLVILLAIAGTIYYLRKKPKKEAPVVKEVPALPTHTIALNQLEDLRNKKLWQEGYVKEYHSELTDILREYLGKRYNIKTQEQTTDEIFAGLRYKDLTEDNRDMLRHILILADLVKFAKEKPIPAENEQSITNAINFVMRTKEEVMPGNTERGEANELV